MLHSPHTGAENASLGNKAATSSRGNKACASSTCSTSTASSSLGNVVTSQPRNASPWVTALSEEEVRERQKKNSESSSAYVKLDTGNVLFFFCINFFFLF